MCAAHAPHATHLVATLIATSHATPPQLASPGTGAQHNHRARESEGGTHKEPPQEDGEESEVQTSQKLIQNLFWFSPHTVRVCNHMRMQPHAHTHRTLVEIEETKRRQLKQAGLKEAACPPQHLRMQMHPLRTKNQHT